MCKRPNFVLFAIIFDGCTLGNKAKTYLFDFEHLDTLSRIRDWKRWDGKVFFEIYFHRIFPISKDFQFQPFFVPLFKHDIIIVTVWMVCKPGHPFVVCWTHRMKAYHFHCAFTNDISMYWKIVRLTITAYYRKLLALVKQLTVTYSHTHIHIHIRIHKDLPWKMNIVLASQITENIVQVCLSVRNTPSQTVFL